MDSDFIYIHIFLFFKVYSLKVVSRDIVFYSDRHFAKTRFSFWLLIQQIQIFMEIGKLMTW